VHAFAQAPQFAGSLDTSVHDAPQACSVVLQFRLQMPPLQTSVALQALPQAPQLELFVFGSMQAPPQASVEASQRMSQTPLSHTALPPVGAGQTLPQAPQLLASLVTLTQRPLHAV
jgi:hypothetical protein